MLMAEQVTYTHPKTKLPSELHQSPTRYWKQCVILVETSGPGQKKHSPSIKIQIALGKPQAMNARATGAPGPAIKSAIISLLVCGKESTPRGVTASTPGVFF